MLFVTTYKMECSGFSKRVRLDFNSCVFIFLSFLCFLKWTEAADTVTVESPFGSIKGKKETDQETGDSFASFTGIPYAEPPVGELRFAKPKPHHKLDDLLDAAQDKRVACPHPDGRPYGEKEFTEDCLILNIFAKNLSPNRTPLRKVNVFIHGGGFILGSSPLYFPKSFVMTQDVIVVTINYRLGVLGFLSTENEASPGNYGLWDQTLALQWVKDNIQAFGGDPDDVTISGESAGGASVGFQMITPHAKGLFSKAYPHSGTATSHFGRSLDSQYHALVVGKMAGCWDKELKYRLSLDESSVLLECLRKAPLSALMSFIQFETTDRAFVPRTDGDFLPEDPLVLLSNDEYLTSIGFFDRHYLMGLNNLESSIIQWLIDGIKIRHLASDERSVEEKEAFWKAYVEDSFLSCIRSRLGDKAVSDSNIVEAVRDFYNRRSTDNVSALIELNADLSFIVPILEFAKVASRQNNTYVFYFDHFPSYMKGEFRGLPHGIDVAYWFDGAEDVLGDLLSLGMQGGFTEEDYGLKSKFFSLLGNFMKYGNPGRDLQGLPFEWPTFDPVNQKYLSFKPRPWVHGMLGKDEQDFWLDTIPKMMDKKPIVHSEL